MPSVYVNKHIQRQKVNFAVPLCLRLLPTLVRVLPYSSSITGTPVFIYLFRWTYSLAHFYYFCINLFQQRDPLFDTSDNILYQFNVKYFFDWHDYTCSSTTLSRISIFQSFFVHSFKMIFYVVILKKRLKTTTLEAIKRTNNSRFALRKKGTFEQLTLLIARLKLFRTYKLLSKPLVLCYFYMQSTFNVVMTCLFIKENFFIKIMVVSKLKKKTKKIARNQEKE